MKKEILIPALVLGLILGSPTKTVDVEISKKPPVKIIPVMSTIIQVKKEIKKEDIKKEVITKVFVAKVKLTAYCNCKYCTGSGRGITASGDEAGKGTLAAPKQLPLYTKVFIDGQSFTVKDRGGAIKIKSGMYVFDVWQPTHKQALKYGVKYGKMYKHGDAYFITVN